MEASSLLRIRKKGASLIRNLLEIAKRQFTRAAKILLFGLLVEFLIFSVKDAFLPGFVPGVVCLAGMVAVFAVSLRFAFKAAEKRTWIERYAEMKG